MAATVTIEELNGAGPSATTITSARFCTSDSASPGNANPVPIPAASFNYSYWKSHRLKFAGTFTQVSNVRLYTDGNNPWTLGTGGEVRVGKRDAGDNGAPSGNYQQAAGTQGTTGHAVEDATNGHAYYKSQGTPTASLFNYTSGSPLTIDSSVYTDNPSTTKHAVLQVKVASDATRGAQAAETFTWLWDEV